MIELDKYDKQWILLTKGQLQDKYPLNFIAEVLGRDCRAVYAKIAVMQRQEAKKMEQAQ